MSSSDVTAIATGDYYLTHNPTGDVYKLNLANATVRGWEEALVGATLFGGDHDNVARDLRDEVFVSQNGSKLQLTGSKIFGDFDVYSDSITSLTVMDSAHASNVVGVEGQGIEVIQSASDAHGREQHRSASILGITTTGAVTSFSQDITGVAFSGSAGSQHAKSGFVAATGVLSEESSLSFHSTQDNSAALITVVGLDRHNNTVTETVDLSAKHVGTSRGSVTQQGAAGSAVELFIASDTDIHSDLTTDGALFNIEKDGVVYGFQVDVSGLTAANKVLQLVDAINSHEQFSQLYTASKDGNDDLLLTAATQTVQTDLVFRTGSDGSAAAQTKSVFKSITSITTSGTVAGGTINVHIQDNTDNFSYRGARTMGDFDIVEGAATVTTSALTEALGVTTLHDFADVDIGAYVLRNKTTGVDTALTVATSSSATNWQNAINTAIGTGKITVAAGAGGGSQANTTALTFTAQSGYAGDFEILDNTKARELTSKGIEGIVGTAAGIAGDVDTMDIELAATGGQDSGTAQGTIELSSSKVFSVTQSSPELAYSTTAPVGPANDNYFTTKASALSTVSNVDLRTQSGASNAISVLDGAIEKISSMRSSLGAIENRLDHTVSNLMNISENTEDARSRIQDADFAAESAKLSKAQVLKQAGVGMLAQANAGAQLVLQLLQ